MSIIRVPYTPRRFRGGLDPLVVSHVLDKYLKPGHRILDPMAGGRTVEREAEKLGMACISNDLYFEKGWDVMQTEGWPHDEGEFNAVFLHPPYFKAKKYGDDPRDLGNITDYWTYVLALKHILSEAKRVTMDGGYLILVIGDRREEGRIRLTHSDIYYLATTELGLSLENYDLWELSATSTPYVSTKHMMMFNWILAFRIEKG